MINKNLRKNTYLAIICFFFTLLPLGFYQTSGGKVAFSTTILMIFLSAVNYKFLIDYHKAIISRAWLVNYPNKLASLLFSCNERRFRLVVSIIPIVSSLIIGRVVFDNLPVIGDSVAQYDHAKLLAKGMFTAAANPFPEFFPMFYIIDTGGRWYSQYQLGHLLMLALGHFLGIVWLINPLMCGASALILYMIAYDNYGLRIARITGVLTIFCTQWLYMASEYMNHNTTLLGCLLFTWAWLRLLKNFKLKYSFLAGLGAGMALITRPITTVAIVLPFGVYGLYKLWQGSAKRWLVILPAVIVTLSLIAWQLYFNLKTTGDILVFGPEKLFGDQVKYGFGHIITTDVFGIFYRETPHNFWRGIGHLSNNLVALNWCLFGWLLPSLFFVFFGWMVFKPPVVSKLMFASTVLLGLAYIPYFYQDFIFGARYMYGVTGFLIIATAIGIERVPAILRIMGAKIKYSEISSLIHFYVCFLIIVGVTVFSLLRYNEVVEQSYDTPTFELDAQFPDNSLVFAKDKRYKQFTVFMPPLDSNRVIYAYDLGKENQKLIDYYPTREVFIETDSGFKKLKRGEKQ